MEPSTIAELIEVAARYERHRTKAEAARAELAEILAGIEGVPVRTLARIVGVSHQTIVNLRKGAGRENPSA